MRKIGAFSGMLIAMALAGPVQAIPTVTNIVGSMGKAENTCVSPIAIFTNQSCSYSGGESIALTVGTPRLWMGPGDAGGYYPAGSLVSPEINGGYNGSDPGDGKDNLPITGSITIENNNTPGVGNGADDSISGTLIIGEGIRTTPGSGGSILERFTSVTHTIPSTIVSSATDNAMGGYDYVIGSAGFPFLISTAVDDFASEMASIASGSTLPPDVNYWDVINGGNVVVGPLGIRGHTPHSVEIVTYAPGAASGGNVEPNIGVTTTAVVADLTCEAGDADADPLIDDDGDPIVACSTALNDDGDVEGAGGAWTISGAEFDNLILSLSTDATGQVVSADAFYTLEYRILALGNENNFKPGNYIGGTLSFTGTADAVDDAASTSSGSAVDIDILANDFAFVDAVTVSLPGAGSSANGGTVVINGVNPGPQAGIDVTYTPPAGFTGQDTFDYSVNDANGTVDAGTVTVTVTGGGGGGGASFPIAPNVGVNTGEQQAVDIVIGALPGVSLGNTPATITVVGQPGAGITSVFGQTITYTPQSFVASDDFEYMIEDADGDTATGTISVAIGPPLFPTAVDDMVTVTENSSVNFDVSINDIPGSGIFHTITLTIPTVNGTVVFEPDATLTYTPDPGAFGADQFRYTLTDENGDESPEATVRITIEKAEVNIKLPSSGSGSSVVGPWSLVFLAYAMWLRRRRNQYASGCPGHRSGGETAA